MDTAQKDQGTVEQLGNQQHNSVQERMIQLGQGSPLLIPVSFVLSPPKLRKKTVQRKIWEQKW